MYNKTFKLDLEDLDIIERSLFDMMNKCENEDQIKKLHNLLGRLHQQKVWYRPKKEVYVGG